MRSSIHNFPHDSMCHIVAVCEPGKVPFLPQKMRSVARNSGRTFGDGKAEHRTNTHALRSPSRFHSPGAHLPSHARGGGGGRRGGDERTRLRAPERVGRPVSIPGPLGASRSREEERGGIDDDAEVASGDDRVRHEGRVVRRRDPTVRPHRQREPARQARRPLRGLLHLPRVEGSPRFRRRREAPRRGRHEPGLRRFHDARPAGRHGADRVSPRSEGARLLLRQQRRQRGSPAARDPRQLPRVVRPRVFPVPEREANLVRVNHARPAEGAGVERTRRGERADRRGVRGRGSNTLAREKPREGSNSRSSTSTRSCATQRLALR